MMVIGTAITVGNIRRGRLHRFIAAAILSATLGVAAMNSMLKLLRGERPESKRLPAEMIVRASTAAPPTTYRAEPNPVEKTEINAL